MRLPFRIPEIPFHPGPRMRKVLRIAGLSLFGLVTFVFALQMSLPLERAKDKLLESLPPSMELTIGSVERGWLPGRIYFKDVNLRTHPTKPDEQPITFFVEKIEANVGLFAMLRGKLSIDIDARIGPGKLSGNVSMLGMFPVGGRGVDIDLSGSDLPSANLPAKLATNGLPMSGKVDLSLAFDLPREKNKDGKLAYDWSKADGAFEFECPTGCSFGDGHSKWKPMVKNRSQQAMVSDGIEIEPIDVTKLDAKLEIKDGHARLTKIESSSPDAELKLDFDMKLAPVLDDSTVTGCVRFKPADGLFKRKPKAEGALRNTGAEQRSDGYFHIKLSETWRDMKRLNAECGPNVKDESPVNAYNTGNTATFQNRGVRPNLGAAPPAEIEKPPPLPPGAPTPPPPLPRPAGVDLPPPPTAGSAGAGSGATPERRTGGNGQGGEGDPATTQGSGEPAQGSGSQVLQ